MKRVLANLNLIAIALIVVGFALLQSLGRALAGGGLLLLGVAAFAAYLVLNRERLKSKNSRLNFIFASNIVVLVVLTLAIVGVVNYLGTKVHKRFDFTEGKIHSIAEQSISVAKNLKKQLNIIAFYSDQNSALYRFRSLMEIYRYYTNKINVEVVDPYKNPSKVKRYEIKSDGTLIFEYDKKDTRIEETSEEAITNAMIKVTRQEEKTIYFTQGHGEPDVDKSDDTGYSEVKGNLEKLSYKVKKLILFQEAAVPENAAALVVAGPQKPLLEKEVYLLEQYLTQKQGRLLLLLNPKQGQELKPLLAKMGLVLEDNVVVEVDPVTRLMGGDYFMPVVAKYPEHAITKNFNYATLFPMARGLAKTSPLPKDVSVDFLASTSPNSWGETNYDNEIKTKKITKDPADKAGPLDIAAAVEVRGTAGQKARLVVVGTSDFASNKYYYFQANGNFFGNIIGWLVEEGDLIAITPKTASPKALQLTQSSSRLIFFYTLIILPLLVFITGIGIWLYRRKL